MPFPQAPEPSFQRFASDQLAAVRVGQLLCSRGELLIAHHDAARAPVMTRTRDHLLNGGDADRFTVTLALDRGILAVLLRDQVDAVVADGRGEADLPAGALHACGDVLFKLHAVHRVNLPDARIGPQSPPRPTVGRLDQSGEKQPTTSSSQA